MTKKYLPHVDGLRAIAVLSVILFHLDVSAFSGGYTGVDMFFVISGFLITGILKSELEQTGSVNLARFYRRRIKRLAPAFLAMALATSLFSMLVFSPTHFQRIGGALASSLASVSNFFFWLEADYFDTSAKLKPFLHTWSLSIEEQFYLLWPATLLVLYKLRLRTLVLPFLFIGSLASLALNIILADGQSSFLSNNLKVLADLVVDGKSTLFFLLPFRIFEFSIGASVVWVFDKRMPWRLLNDLLTWTGLGLIAYAVFKFDEGMLFPYWFALVPCIGTALVIYAGANSYSRVLISNPVAVGVGLISYSLYLVHWPIIVFWYYLGGGELDLADQLGASLLTLILAYMLYRFVEQRFRQPKFFRFKPAWRTTASMAFLALFASGVHSYSTEGWAWRTGEPIINLDEVGDAGSFHKAYYGGAGYPYYGPVGESTDPDIVLMGDSHGRHYAEGINTVFLERKGLDFYMASGSSCFHLPGFTRITEGHDWDKICTDRLEEALDYIKTASTPPVVVVSHSWRFQMSVAGLLSKEESEVGISNIIKGILEFKELIGDAPLIVIGEVPGAGANLYDIFTRPKPLMFYDFDRESYLFNTPKEHRPRINNALKKAAESTDSYVFVDPFDYLCSDNKCRNTDDQKRLIYSDAAHLSKFGSLYLIEAMQSEIDRALEGRLNE